MKSNRFLKFTCCAKHTCFRALHQLNSRSQFQHDMFHWKTLRNFVLFTFQNDPRSKGFFYFWKRFCRSNGLKWLLRSWFLHMRYPLCTDWSWLSSPVLCCLENSKFDIQSINQLMLRLFNVIRQRSLSVGDILLNEILTSHIFLSASFFVFDSFLILAFQSPVFFQTSSFIRFFKNLNFSFNCLKM